MNVNSSIKKAFLILALVAMALTLVACPPQLPCDEKITDPQDYQYKVLSNPVIEQINRQLHILQVSVSECIVDDKAQVFIRYALPTSYSQYELTYADSLTVSYSKDGSIALSDGVVRQSIALDRDTVLGFFKEKIKDTESNARVQEFLANFRVDTSQSFIYLEQPHVKLQAVKGPDSIEYTLFSGELRGYILPSHIEWKEFPEIKRAYEIIEAHLLIGDLSSCVIDQTSFRGYTSVQFHDGATRPWYMTIAVLCAGQWKSAFVQLNADGSYERLELKDE